MPQNQHFVHQSYLRGFADDEQFLTEYTKTGTLRTRRAVKRVFAKTDMMERGDGAPPGELEAKWGAIESICGEPLHRIRQTRSLSHPDDPIALAITAALHWARGLQLRSASERLADGAIEHRYYGVLDRLHELEEKFLEEFERAPEPGEVAEIARESFDKMRASNFLAVSSMANNFQKFVDWVNDKQVQLLLAPEEGTGFSTSDSPLVIADKKTNKVGLNNGLALGDSSLVLMPVSRRLACTFTKTDSAPLRLSSRSVELINKEYTWRHAVSSVVAHPLEHPSGVVPNFKAWAEKLEFPR